VRVTSEPQITAPALSIAICTIDVSLPGPTHLSALFFAGLPVFAMHSLILAVVILVCCPITAQKVTELPGYLRSDDAQ
jgi:hypothetical protein